MLSLVDEVVAQTGASRTATAERLLYAIELLSKNNLLPKEVGLDFFEATQMLNARGLGAKHLDPVMMAGGEHVDIDVSLLERSSKSKSNFAGVYSVNGTSFRAMVPDFDGNGGTKYLASRPTALRAAIDRYEYFTLHGIPYGNIGRHVEHWRKMRPFATMDEIIQILRSEADNPSYKDPFTSEQLDAWLERYEAANPKPAPTGKVIVQAPPNPDEQAQANARKWAEVRGFDPDELTADPAQAIVGMIADVKREAVKQEARSRLVSVPDKVVCVLCSDEIMTGEPFGPYGKKLTDYAHVSCINDAPA